MDARGIGVAKFGPIFTGGAGSLNGGGTSVGWAFAFNPKAEATINIAPVFTSFRQIKLGKRRLIIISPAPVNGELNRLTILQRSCANMVDISKSVKLEIPLLGSEFQKIVLH